MTPKHILSKSLLWFGGTVMVLAYAIAGLSVVSYGYVSSGLPGLFVAMVLVAALPALVVGMWLEE